MKTERMVLLVTPEEKARIGAESAKLGVSASEYIRKLVNLLDADDVIAAEQLVLLAPELTAMADRWEQTFADFDARDAERERKWAEQNSPEYREKIRQDVLNDPNINWDAVRKLFAPADEASSAAA